MGFLNRLGVNDENGLPAYLSWLKSQAWPAILQAELGGAKDAAALTMMGAGLTATSPYVALSGLGAAGAVLPVALAATGSYWMANRLFEDITEAQYLKSVIGIQSGTPPVCGPNEGMLVGFTADGGVPIRIPDWALTRHFMTGGMTGVGKTVSSILFMAQQIARGGGVLWIDGKLDPANILLFFHLAKWMGREADIRIINPGDPQKSNTYNFVLYGDADEVASRIMSTVPSTEGNAGADYYKQAANHGLTCLISTIKGLGMAYNCMDLAILLSNDKALLNLQKMVNSSPNLSPKIGRLFSLFLESLTTRNNQGETTVDVKKLKDVFGGVAGRLFVYGVDKMGEITSSYSPDVRLFEDIRDNRLIYCALPTMGKLVAAQNFGKAMLGDLRSAVALIQSLPSEHRPNPPFMTWMDEVQSYGSAKALDTQFQQNRSANIFLGAGYQTDASIEALEPAFLDAIVGNTYTKLFFKPASRLTADAWADLIGKHKVASKTYTQTFGAGTSAASLRVTPDSMASDNRGVAMGIREAEEYRISAEKLMRLDNGQAICLFGASKVFDLRVPMLNFDPRISQELGDVVIQRPRASTRDVKGLDLFGKHGEFVSELSATPGVKKAKEADSKAAIAFKFGSPDDGGGSQKSKKASGNAIGASRIFTPLDDDGAI
jgi:hypothetical protein